MTTRRPRPVLIALAALAIAGGSVNLARAAEKAGEKDKEENEQKVAIDDVPKAVRKTLKREANGAKIETVDKEQRDGKTVYEADATIAGHNYEIVVDAKGVLLSKTLDEAGDKAKETGEGEPKEKAKAKSGKKAKKAESAANREHDESDGKK